MFRTEDLVEESRGKRGLCPVQAPHTECDELSSCRSVNSGTDSRPNCSLWRSTRAFYISIYLSFYLCQGSTVCEEAQEHSTSLYICLFIYVRGLQSRFFSRKCLSVSSVNSGTDSRPNCSLWRSTRALYISIYLSFYLCQGSTVCEEAQEHSTSLYICLFIYVRGLQSRFF